MRYVSPAFLFGTAFQLPLDAKMIQRERKKLLAELELGGSDDLDVNGRRFTKNELIDYFEELQHENIAAYHQAVSRDPILLKFLQTASIDKDAKFSQVPIYDDPGFIGWMSPYFHSTFTKFATDCLEHTDAPGMRAILDNKLLMTIEDKERAWLFITGILEKNIALFEHHSTRSQRNAFIGHGYLEVIKQLPNSRFARLKDRYAFSILHPALANFNRNFFNRSRTIIWLQDALELAVSGDIKMRIGYKLVELSNIHQKVKKTIPVLVLIVIVAIIAIVLGVYF